jgi:hypothetical protein|nr:MAG TPA: hypothetical protein [Caudoviricetes sp.]
MADAILKSGGVGGVSSDDVTAKRNQILRGVTTITSDSDGEVVEGSFPVVSDADARQEFWYYNDHGKDSYVTRIPESAYVKYYNSDGSQSWEPWIRIPRNLIKNSINYHPELTIDSVTTLNERGQIPDRGDGGAVSYLQGREDWANRIWVLFKNGWYHRNPWDDGHGHIHEAYTYVTYEQLRNLFGIDGSKMLQGYNIAGANGQIPVHPNEKITTEIVNIHWTTPKKFGFRFPQGYYPNSGQYPPIVEVNYGDLASALGIRADKMLNDINILGVQGAIPYWVSYTKHVISAINNEGFAWDDDTGANRGRGIVSKIANGHVIAGADYVFLPSPNLYPHNIRQGVNINGVVGTMPDYSTGRTVFNGATFDRTLLLGVADKDYFVNRDHYPRHLDNAYRYSGIYDGGINLNLNTTMPSIRGRYIGCVFSQSINLTPFNRIDIYWRVLGEVKNGGYINFNAGISKLNSLRRNGMSVGGSDIDGFTEQSVVSYAESPAIAKSGKMELYVGGINEQAFLYLYASANISGSNDLVNARVQITRIDFLN